jgi:hypothetical protein
MEHQATLHQIDLTELECDQSLGRDVAALLCIKGNNQRERTATQRSYMREREQSLGKQAFLGRTHTPREPSLGKIACFHFGEDAVPAFAELASPNHLAALWEPHQVSFQYGWIVAVENTRVIMVDGAGRERIITSPWFRSLHSAQLVSVHGGEPDQLLVSSAGIDAVLLCDIRTPSTTVLAWWSALNLPGSQTRSGRTLRLDEDGDLWEYDAAGTVLCTTPLDELHSAGLANGDRTLCINDAHLVDDTILVTSFHAGQVATVVLGMEDSYRPMANGFRQPHSLVTQGGAIRSIVSSAAGIFHYFDQVNGASFTFGTVEGKDAQDREREWLQSATSIAPDLYAVVDVNRRQITLLDVHGHRYRHVKYDPNLAIQMVAPDQTPS